MRTAIIDLDETLLHTFVVPNDIANKAIWNSSPELRSRTYELIFDDHDRLYGIMRPGCREFLRKVREKFDQVIVWSAGTYDYVSYLVSYLFAGLDKPDDVLCRDQCQTIDEDFHKPIRYLRRRNLTIDTKNTIIFDDRMENFLANPKNGVLIPAYLPPTTIRGLCLHKDDYLYHLITWMDSSTFESSLFSWPKASTVKVIRD